MNFSDKNRYNRLLQKVIPKGEESVMKYIKRFQNTQDLSVSVQKRYYEDQLMHICLDNFHQSGNYTA